jgi:tetratricopeptide (TPR) repeat protein
MKQACIVVLAAVAVCAGFPATGQMGGYGGGYGGSYNSMSMRTHLDDYAMAKRLIQHEKYSDAIPYLERALAARPRSADVLDSLGYAHHMTGDDHGAVAWLEKALAEDPDHKGAHENLGEVYLALHDVTSARAQLTELARLCPSDCDERQALTKAVNVYLAANPSSAAAPAAPAHTALPAATAPAPAQPSQAAPQTPSDGH